MTDDNAGHPAWTVLPAAERAAAGRAVRARVPRSSLGQWTPPAGRDPLAVLAAQDVSRAQDLVPLRHERMAQTPFTFFRGAAAVFADDIAAMPRTGLDVQLCGDAHLANFGVFASPDRTLVFDLNDFDETLPGPFEWDLRRLVASFEVAARDRGFAEAQRESAATETVLAYVAEMRELAARPALEVWYARVTVDDIAERWGAGASKAVLRRFQRNVERAKSKDRLRAFTKLIEPGDPPRFRSDPPVLVPTRELVDQAEHERLWASVEAALGTYAATLQPDRRRLLERYRLVDLARKVVGVGSVGTRCWVALLIGDTADDPLFIQIKEAERSVLEPYLGDSEYSQHGERVVQGQRLVQSSPDVLLGWGQVPGLDSLERDYYYRQLWDWKGSADLEHITPEALSMYASLCGLTLARAHARTGDPVAIAAYLGGGRTAARSLADFAVAYADQAETDHAAFT